MDTPGTAHIWRDNSSMSRNTAATTPQASQLAADEDDDDDGGNDTLFSFSDAIAAAERDSPRLSPDLLDDFFLNEASYRAGRQGGSSNGLRGRGSCGNGEVTKHVGAAAAPLLPRPSSMSGVCAGSPAAAWRFTKLPWIGRHSISSTPCSLTAAASAISLP